jgi:hypothetical protein
MRFLCKKRSPECRAPTPAPEKIDGYVDRDPSNPGRDPRLVLKVADAPENTNEHVLRNIQSVFPVQRNLPCDTVDRLPIPKVQFVSSGTVTRLASFNQLGVGKIYQYVNHGSFYLTHFV